MISPQRMNVNTNVKDSGESAEGLPPSPVPSNIAPPEPAAKEKKKRAPKKLKPAKGPAKIKAKSFITEIIPLITGDKTFCYRITHPDADGKLVQDTMEFEIAGKLIVGDEKEILSNFGIVFEKGRTSVVHIKQDTKRISKETGQKCVNMYGYVVQDGEWTRMDSSDLDKFLFTNPQTGFCMPRDPGVSVM